MKKKLILMAGLMTIGLSAHANPLVFPEGDVHASHTLGKVTVSHDSDGYRVTTAKGSQLIESHKVDKSIRDLTSDQLSKALGKMYLTVKGDDENDLSLEMNVRGPGGAFWGAVFLGQKGVGLGTAFGAMIGGPVGAAIGAAVGGAIGAAAGAVAPV